MIKKLLNRFRKKKEIKTEEKKPTVSIVRSPRKCILDLVNEGDICCEIGVWQGVFSRQILNKSPSILHLIDPWVHQEYKGRVYSICKQKAINDIYRNILSELGEKNNIKIHRMFSNNASQLFLDRYFDFVYIDGNHSYEYVVDDILSYLPKVKINGYLCGDDYHWKDKDRNNELSVQKAVDRILPNCTIQNGQFIYQKKKEDLWRFHLLNPAIQVGQYNIII